MSDRTSRAWWPFEVIPENRRTDQHKAEIDFLVRATDIGCRAYVDGSDLGAVADNGRECRIVWHGNHRRELLSIDDKKDLFQHMFTNPEEGAAFTEAAQAALAFLEKGALAAGKSVSSARRS